MFANSVFLSTILLAMICSDGMEWLVEVPDEVDDELQRLDSVLAGRILVAQHAPEVLDAIYHAVLVVLFHPFVRFLGTKHRALRLSNHDIGEKLSLSEHTVKNYIFRIFEKLGVSRLAAVCRHQLGSMVGGCRCLCSPAVAELVQHELDAV